MRGLQCALQESADNNNPGPGVKLGLAWSDDVSRCHKTLESVTQTYDSLEDSAVTTGWPRASGYLDPCIFSLNDVLICLMDC